MDREVEEPTPLPRAPTGLPTVDEPVTAVTEELTDDRIDVGRPQRRTHTRRRRIGVRLVAVVTVLALSAAGTVGAIRLLDTRRTVTQEELATAITSFRPSTDSAARVQSAAELSEDDGYLPEPAVCAGLVLVAPDGAQGGASWYGSVDGSVSSVNVRAVRFADPAAARGVMTDLRAALPRCRTIVFAPKTPEGVTFGLTPMGRTGVLAPRDRLSYRLVDRSVPTAVPTPGRTTDSPDRANDPAQPDFEIYIRRAGNVVIWGVGPQAEFETLTRVAVDDLTSRLQVLAAS